MKRNFGPFIVFGAVLVLLVVAYRWLGGPFPGSAPTTTSERVATPSVRTSPTSVDIYDQMGTLTFRGRTIPSARLAPGEYDLLNWIDDSGLHINEIRPAEGWPSSKGSLPDVMRGAGVVHALLVPPSTVMYDVVSLGGALNTSVCPAPTADQRVVSYHLTLAGRTATIDYADALYFAAHENALIITTDGDAWSRLRASGGSAVSCANNGQ